MDKHIVAYRDESPRIEGLAYLTLTTPGCIQVVCKECFASDNLIYFLQHALKAAKDKQITKLFLFL